MKAITLWQPWATLVAHGYKRIETRSWKTNYRGPLAIHAAKKWNRELRELCLTEPFRSCLKEIYPDKRHPLPRGGVIATVGLYEIVEASWVFPGRCARHGGEHEESFGDYSPGRYAWLLTEPSRFEMIPYRGRQGLWNWESIEND